MGRASARCRVEPLAHLAHLAHSREERPSCARREWDGRVSRRGALSHPWAPSVGATWDVRPGSRAGRVPSSPSNASGRRGWAGGAGPTGLGRGGWAGGAGQAVLGRRGWVDCGASRRPSSGVGADRVHGRQPSEVMRPETFFPRPSLAVAPGRTRHRGSSRQSLHECAPGRPLRSDGCARGRIGVTMSRSACTAGRLIQPLPESCGGSARARASWVPPGCVTHRSSPIGHHSSARRPAEGSAWCAALSGPAHCPSTEHRRPGAARPLPEVSGRAGILGDRPTPLAGPLRYRGTSVTGQPSPSVPARRASAVTSRHPSDSASAT